MKKSIFSTISFFCLCFMLLCGTQSAAEDGRKTYKDMSALLKAAKGGDAEAQYQLGMKYKKGEGVVQDNQEAAGWFGEASKLGHLPGTYELGECYQRIAVESEKQGQKGESYRRMAAQSYRRAAWQAVRGFVQAGRTSLCRRRRARAGQSESCVFSLCCSYLQNSSI